MNRAWLNLHGGTVFVLAAALLWGTTGTAATFAPTISALTIGAAAMGIGGLLQAGFAATTIAAHRLILANNWHILARSAIAAAVYPLAFYTSMRLAGVAAGTVVSIGSAPLFAVVADFLFSRRALSLRQACGLSIGVAGVAILAFTPSHAAEATGAGAARGLGIALGLVAGATYALYTWGGTQVMRCGCPSRAAMGTIFGSAALLLLPVVALTAGPVMTSPKAAGVIGYLAIVPMFLGYIMFGKGLETITATAATMLTLLEPAAAALIAFAVLGERLSPSGWAGIAALFASLMCTTTKPVAASALDLVEGHGQHAGCTSAVVR